MRSKLFHAAVLLVLASAFSCAASAASLVYYPYPYTTPTVNYTSIAGGFSYSGFNPSQYTDMYYVVDAATAGNAPCVGINECTSSLTFDSTLNTPTALSSGNEYFTGSGGPLGQYAELEVTTSSPLTPAGSIPYSPGVPTADGAAVHVTGDFSATFAFFLSTSCTNPAVITTCTFQNADSVYSNYAVTEHLPATDQYITSVNGAFYYSTPVPLPAAAWLLLSALTGFGVIGHRRRPS
jgi:hypothetical protein